MTQLELDGRRLDAAATALRTTFGGAVHVPGDAAYDDRRLPWNRRIDPRPAIVVDAAEPTDIAVAVRAARDHGLPFAVQATGHGTCLPADDGLLLRTTRMARVEVDPERRRVVVGPGAVWADVIAAAAPYGLAPLSGTPAIGVAGFTLGGGTGWLSRTHGYAADSLVRAELVTSTGAVVTATAAENADLFWAIRGGSGNFGVATELELRLYPVTDVLVGTSLYAADHAAATFTRYAEWARDEPDGLSTSVSLFRTPAALVLAIRAFALPGSQRRLPELVEVAGAPRVDDFGPTTFAAAAASSFGGPPPPPMAVVQDIDLFDEITGEVVDAMVDAIGNDSSLTAVELRHWGGAMARPGPDAGPVGHRDVPFSVISTAIAGAAGPAPAEAATAALHDRIRPHATGGSFLNFLADPARTATAYTAADHRRLREVKRTWDPGNVFRLNHNIPPAAAGDE